MKRKHAILIGGTKSIGRELAELLAGQGQWVTVVGRTSIASPAHAGPGTIEGVSGDLEQPDSLLSALVRQVERCGPVSSLVFLQRYRGHGDAWSGEFAVSLTATKTLLDGLAPHFDRDGDRAVCIVGSPASERVARRQTLAYHTAKAALKQLARYYAVRLGPQGIRVNMVSPCTFVKAESAAYFEDQPDLRELYRTITPLGRMCTAIDVAKAIAFLCSPEAAFITGQDLAVDGGLSLMLQDTLARELMEE